MNPCISMHAAKCGRAKYRGSYSQLKGYGGYKILFSRPFAETQVSWGFHRFFPPVWLGGFVKKPEGVGLISDFFFPSRLDLCLVGKLEVL